MFDRPVPHLVKAAIKRLTLSEDFQKVKSWLEAELDEADKQNRFLETPFLYRNQGRAQAVDAILSAIRDANKNVAS